MGYPRKGKVRFGTLGAVLASIGGAVVTVVSDPAILGTVAGKVGVSTAVLGAIVAGVKKAVTREEHER